MIDFVPAYAAIVARLRTGLGNVKVYDTNVPLDVEKATLAGHFSPYAVITLGGGTRAARGRHMINSRWDIMQYWVVVTTIAPENGAAMQLKSEVIDLLFGFVPPDAGELTPEGGQAQSAANENRIPLVFQHRAMFHFYQNMET